MAFIHSSHDFRGKYSLSLYVALEWRFSAERASKPQAVWIACTDQVHDHMTRARQLYLDASYERRIAVIVGCLTNAVCNAGKAIAQPTIMNRARGCASLS